MDAKLEVEAVKQSILTKSQQSYPSAEVSQFALQGRGPANIRALQAQQKFINKNFLNDAYDAQTGDHTPVHTKTLHFS